MFRSFIFTTTTIAVVWGSSAIAADAVNEVPSAPTAVETSEFSWAGGYAGIHGGYGWMEGTLSQGGLTEDGDFNGGRVGGFGGWNFDVGHNFILGVEADVSYDWNDVDFTSTNKVGTDVSGSVRGRAGYAVDHALFFVSSGFTATKGYWENVIADQKETFKGWTVGAGVDFALTKNIFTRVEYRYNDYGDTDFRISSSPLNFDTKQHAVNIGLAVKF
ncbi:MULTISPECIES: outer membrane protein [unclassified Rhizobium]|uniref:outer membrane protein n=1 Tax=unclassified Rhizobium TaxID=2613769 RepID=UPI001786E22E|nr:MULTISPECIES: outer membrane protein [unclassified Rhizobium]MBD8689093.1 porin family protein [Rhizobium sp. CFBP 13644]MBD8693561.1 porin family protein [Rhizobium sp. CFBP 13717]